MYEFQIEKKPATSDDEFNLKLYWLIVLSDDCLVGKMSKCLNLPKPVYLKY